MRSLTRPAGRKKINRNGIFALLNFFNINILWAKLKKKLFSKIPDLKPWTRLTTILKLLVFFKNKFMRKFKKYIFQIKIL